MAAPNYTALAPPPQLQPPLAVANFKNERAISRATAKTRINMRPPNSIHMRGLSTTSDQIPNKDSPVAPSAGNPCHDLFYKVVKPYKYQYRTKKNPEAEAEVLRYVKHSNLRQAAELHWKAMVEDIYLKQGKFKNCLVVFDPGKTRIRGLKEDVSSALGILVAELSEEPWKGKVISFSKLPELHRIQGDDFRYKCEFVKRMDRKRACKCDFVKGMDSNSSTDIKKVFDLILEVAVNENLEPEQMIKKVFVFSRQVLKKEDYPYDKYFQDDGRPLIPYEPGVTIVCDFSINLLKIFMENDGEIGPDQFIEATISDEEYQKLAVVD
ncbi:hypothetical protein C1H46_029468 [Malus baccata]|uniref:DUF7788 domain-containing protein n=1 Tax=Malus baccata TaxID=106549 RepID=A0A540LF94_MALBA|nr:hypothetical protein C1H46_029468 [Malus baccata]